MTRAHVAFLLLVVLGLASSGCYRHHHYRHRYYGPRSPRARVVYAPAPVIHANTVIVYGAPPPVRVYAPAPQPVIVQAPAPAPASTIVVVTPPVDEPQAPPAAPAQPPQQPPGGWYDEE